MHGREKTKQEIGVQVKNRTARLVACRAWSKGKGSKMFLLLVEILLEHGLSEMTMRHFVLVLCRDPGHTTTDGLFASPKGPVKDIQ